MVPKDISDCLKKCSIFSTLTDDELNIIAGLSRVKEFEAGEILYDQEEPGNTFYVLSKGQVSLLRRYSLEQERKASVTVYVSRATPLRRLLGCWSALIGEEHIHMCAAQCDTACQVISINCSMLRDVIGKNTNMRLTILERLISDLRDRLVCSYEAIETL